MTKQLTLKTPNDAIEAVPYLLGFTPADSLVLLCPGGPHARVDMPHTADDVDEVLSGISPLWQHAAKGALVIGYDVTDSEHFDLLVAALGSQQRPVIDAFRYDGTLIHRFGGETMEYTGSGVAADLVADGIAPAPSRDALSIPAEADPALVSRHAAASSGEELDEARWIAGRSAEYRLMLTEEELVRLTAALVHRKVRDAACVHLVHDTEANDRLAFWRDAAHRLGQVSPRLCTVYAMAAWMSGHGAEAWCAIDRCGDESMARLIAVALPNAMNPKEWTPTTLEEILNEVSTGNEGA